MYYCHHFILSTVLTFVLTNCSTISCQISHVNLDASVLVALISKSDRDHAWAIREWSQVIPPALTCEAVISETCFLLKKRYLIESVFEMIAVGAIAIDRPRRIENEPDTKMKMMTAKLLMLSI